MALFIIDIIKKNRTTVNYNLLLNDKRVVSFYQDTDGGTIFFYKTLDDRRESTIEYKTTLSKFAFNQRLAEADGPQFVNLYILTRGHRTENKKFRIATDSIILGEDIGSNPTTSYLYVADGSFKTVRYKTRHIISEINETASAGTSLSPS